MESHAPPNPMQKAAMLWPGLGLAGSLIGVAGVKLAAVGSSLGTASLAASGLLLAGAGGLFYLGRRSSGRLVADDWIDDDEDLDLWVEMESEVMGQAQNDLPAGIGAPAASLEDMAMPEGVFSLGVATIPMTSLVEAAHDAWGMIESFAQRTLPDAWDVVERAPSGRAA